MSDCALGLAESSLVSQLFSYSGIFSSSNRTVAA